MVGPEASDKQRAELRAFAFRLLGSRIGAPASGDEFQLAEAIKRRLVTCGEPAITGLRFAELYRRFAHRKAVSKRWAVLDFLSSLQDNAKDNTDTFAGGIAALALMDPQPVGASPPPLEGAPDGATQRPASIPPKQRGKEDAFEVPEGVLLRDVVFAMQGIDGAYVKYDKTEDAYTVSKQHGVPSATRDLISRICETGWLYKRVNAFVLWCTSNKSVGMVAQGLAAGLQVELTEYYRLVSVLQAHVTGDGAAEGGDRKGRMTLRRLLVWVHEPLSRLRAMAMLCDAAADKAQQQQGGAHARAVLKGGQLCSALCSLALHGDAAVSAVVERVLKVACAPVLHMIKRWLSDGEMDDPYGEFLIEGDVSVPEHNWEDKYRLRAKMLPSFVSQDLAAKILLVGKSINFMRRCCRNVSFETNSPAHQRAALEYGDWGGLEAAVEAAAERTNGVLVSALLERYKLRQHCEAIKRFILFGQGDFVRHLMDLLLDNVRPGSVVSHHSYNLNGIVDTAIRSSFSQGGDESDVRERVHVCADEATTGDDLLTVFCLEYKVDAPCNCVITERAMRKYKRIFHFLWNLQRVHQALNSSWRRCSSISHVGSHDVLCRGRDRETYKELQSFVMESLHQGGMLVTHHEMLHFVTTLQYYIMFEVLECSWTQFQIDMQAAKDLDQLIQSHNTYVDAILERSLLTEDSEKERRLVERVFKAILECCSVQDQLCDYTGEQLERQRALVRREEQMAAAQQWGVEDNDDALDRPQLTLPLDLVSIMKTKAYEGCSSAERALEAFWSALLPLTRELHWQFKMAFGNLRESLSMTDQADLRSLNFRLDFSHFYSSNEPV